MPALKGIPEDHAGVSSAASEIYAAGTCVMGVLRPALGESARARREDAGFSSQGREKFQTLILEGAARARGQPQMLLQVCF
jgi:hypothetical protein